MSAILDAAKRLRTGLVLIPAMLAAGCGEKTDEPFVDPEFDFVLITQGSPPPCDCLEQVTRFGGVISFDEQSRAWVNSNGDPVDLKERAQTESPYYPGDTWVLWDANLGREALVESLAQLGNAGICRFMHVAPPINLPVEFYFEEGDDNQTLVPTYLYAFKTPEGQRKLCQIDKEPVAAQRGYSRSREIWEIY